MVDFIWLKMFSQEEWCNNFPYFSLLPQTLRNYILSIMPYIRLAEVKIQSPNGSVTGSIYACSEKKNPQSLYPMLKKIKPNYVGCKEIIPILNKNEIGNNQLKATNGKMARILFSIEVIKQYFKSEKNPISPKIFIWGADWRMGELFAKICVEEGIPLVIGGTDRAKLENLAHATLYQTGVSLRISSNPNHDIKNCDIVVLARPIIETNELSNELSLSMLQNKMTLGLDEDFSDFNIEGPEISFQKTKLKIPIQWDFVLVETVVLAFEGDVFADNDLINSYKKFKKSISKHAFKLERIS